MCAEQVCVLAMKRSPVHFQDAMTAALTSLTASGVRIARPAEVHCTVKWFVTPELVDAVKAKFNDGVCLDRVNHIFAEPKVLHLHTLKSWHVVYEQPFSDIIWEQLVGIPAAQQVRVLWSAALRDDGPEFDVWFAHLCRTGHCRVRT